MASHVACSATAQESTVARALVPAAVDARRVEQDIATAQRNKSVGVLRFSVRAKSALPDVPVPVFLPADSLGDYEKGLAPLKGDDGNLKSAGEQPLSTFVAHPDGYLASRAFDRFNLVVRGTNAVFTTGDEKAAQAAASADYLTPFSENEAGGDIGFGYAGAHYSASFECRRGGTRCIVADEAQRIVDEFLMCGFDDRCVERGTKLIRRP